jgi:2-oxo-3-hexenedioate decarboxylase
VSPTRERAESLWRACRDREPIEPFTDEEPDLGLPAAYEIQRELRSLHLADGARVNGAKLGLTSRAKQEAMGVHAPLHGFLTDRMELAIDEALRVGERIHPRAEPEIAFVLGEDIAGPGATLRDVLAATSGVAVALEVIDSRFRDFRFKLPDVVADDASASAFVLGPPVPPEGIDLALAGCVLTRNGTVEATAAGAAVLGHPAAAVAWLANELGERGEVLRAGWVILSGGLTAPVPLGVGDHVVAEIAHLGSVTLRGVA